MPYISSNVVEAEDSSSAGKPQGRYIFEDQYWDIINKGTQTSTSGEFQTYMVGILAILSNVFSHLDC